MSVTRTGRGVRTGLLAAAATIGVLAGFGLRDGSVASALTFYGLALLATYTGAHAPPAVAIVVGLAVHTAWMVLWGVCFTLAATPPRAARLLLVTAGALIVVLAVAWRFVPGTLGAASVGGLGVAQLRLYALLLCVTLAAGTRLTRG